MSESFYLYAFGDASDALFQYIGITGREGGVVPTQNDEKSET